MQKGIERLNILGETTVHLHIVFRVDDPQSGRTKGLLNLGYEPIARREPSYEYNMLIEFVSQASH